MNPIPFSFPLTIEIVADLVGVIITAVSIVILFDLRNKANGLANTTLNFAMLGMIATEAAFLWTIIFDELRLIKEPIVDLHHPLMALGAVFFVIASRNFPIFKNPPPTS